MDRADTAVSWRPIVRFAAVSSAAARCLQSAVWLLPWLLLVWHLRIPWTRSPQYQYGWVVLPILAYFSWCRWAEIRDLSGRGRGAFVAAIVGAVLLAPVWWLREATPDWAVINFSLAGLVLGITASLVALRGGWPAARQMLGPLILILAAIPWPYRFETWMIQALSRFVASVTTEVLLWMGAAAEQRHNVIALSTGTVGISEACSGLRSIQSSILAALALGELHRLLWNRRLFLVLTGIALAVAWNVLRNVLLCWVAFARGFEALNRWHDPAGWGILLLSLPVLFFLAARLRGRTAVAACAATRSTAPPLSNALALAFVFWFAAIIGGVEAWYRAHEDPGLAFQPLEVRWPAAARDFHFDAVPDRTRDVLLCSQAHSASWTHADGTRWAVTSVEWSPRETSPQFARVHRPAVCLQAIGLDLIREQPAQILPVTGGSLAFEPLEMRAGQTPVYVFAALYEHGNRDSVCEIEETAWSRFRRALAGQRNHGQQLIEIRVAGFPSYAAALAAVSAHVAALLRQP
jgi:exosortase